MPLYEYLCTRCGHRFEVLQRLGEGAEKLSCPSCDANRVEKQFSTFAASSSEGGGTTARAASGCGAPGGFG